MPRKRAFTLIELLVVISIIALLISILLPALGKARETALTLSCLSKERQTGLVYHVWLNDNDDRTLYWAADGGMLWSAYLSDQYPQAMGKPSSNDATLGNSLLICPKDDKPVGASAPLDYPFYTIELGSSYAMNADINVNGPLGYRGVLPGGSQEDWRGERFGLITSPGKHILLMDTLGHRTATRRTEAGVYVNYRVHRGNYLVSKPDPLRHQGVGNLLYFDGHASSVQPDDIKLEEIRYDHRG